MFTTLLIAALLVPAAPVPRDTAPTGPAPYILNLKAGQDGEVKVTVMRTEKQKVTVFQVVGGPGGAQAVQPVEREVPVQKFVQLGLADLKDVKAYSADGKEVAIKDAVKKANDGGLFIASANGQKVDPVYLKLFKDDVLVFVSPDLVPQGGYGYGGGMYPPPGLPFNGPGAIPAMPIALPPAPPIGGPGGAVQIQVLPAVEVAPPALVPVEKKKD